MGMGKGDLSKKRSQWRQKLNLMAWATDWKVEKWWLKYQPLQPNRHQNKRRLKLQGSPIKGNWCQTRENCWTRIWNSEVSSRAQKSRGSNGGHHTEEVSGCGIHNWGQQSYLGRRGYQDDGATWRYNPFGMRKSKWGSSFLSFLSKIEAGLLENCGAWCPSQPKQKGVAMEAKALEDK